MSTGFTDYNSANNQYDPADDADDYVIGGGNATIAVPTGRDAEKIQEENAFENVPPGDHILVIKGFVGKPHEEYRKVYMPDGTMSGYKAVTITVEFMLPGKPRCTVRDNFTVPPVAPYEHAAYFDGKLKAEDDRGGFFANKFLHFISRIGFDYPPGGQLPPAALVLKNWKGRAVHATVTPAKPYTAKDGTKKDGYPQIKLFSYKPVNGAAALAQPSGNGNGNGNGGQPASQRNAAQSQSQPAAASATAAAGLDDI